MKKKISILICLLSIILWCCGCKNDTIVDSGETDGRFMYAATWGGRLIRYDVVSKKATIACPDPLCAHGEDCLVTNIDRLTVMGDYLCLVRGEFEGDVYLYDIKQGTIVKILDASQATNSYMIGNNIYFSASQYEYADDGSLSAEVWHVYQYDVATSNLKKISQNALASSVTAISHDDHSIIWEDNDGRRFSSDYNFQNIVDNVPASDMKVGEYAYSVVTHYHDGTYIFKIERTNVKADITETLQDGVMSFRWDVPQNPQGLIYIPSSHSDENSLFYIDINTNEKRKLCDIPSGVSVSDIFVVEGNEFIVGDYIAFYVHKSGESNEEEIMNSESMMFVNIKTGDNFIITP